MKEYTPYLMIPFVQGILFLSITLVLLLLIRPSTPDKAWTWAGVLFLLFMLTNSTILIFAENIWSYAGLSILSSIGYLFLISGLMEFHIRLFRLNGSGENSMIFLSIIYHPALLVVGMVVKWIIK